MRWAVVKPDTLVRWHRAGFRSYWPLEVETPVVVGRLFPVKIRRLIREMSIANPLWERRGSTASFSRSASISGRRAWPSIWPGVEARPSQGLEKHFSIIMPTASRRWICFVVPTISFSFASTALLIMGHGRRQISLVWRQHRNPTAEWMAKFQSSSSDMGNASNS